MNVDQRHLTMTTIENVMKHIVDVDLLHQWETIKNSNLTMEELCAFGEKVREKIKEECSICYEAYEHTDTVTTNCKHVFHTKCLQTWVAERDTCPLCRRINPLQGTGFEVVRPSQMQNPWIRSSYLFMAAQNGHQTILQQLLDVDDATVPQNIQLDIPSDDRLLSLAYSAIRFIERRYTGRNAE